MNRPEDFDCRRRRPWPLCALIAAAVSLNMAARAQQDDALPPREPDTAAPVTDVYLDDSFEAADAVSRATKLAQRGKWHEAAQLLQATSDAAGRKLMATAPGHYVGIRAHVSAMIAAWPPEGIEAYRLLFEREVELTLRDRDPARPIEELLDLFERFFCTSSAARLADRIAQRAIEAGDFPLAERVYADVLARHPDRKEHQQRYSAMLGALALLRGEPLDGKLAAATVTWQGAATPLAEVAGKIAERFPALHTAPPPGDWPLFHGDAARSRLGATSVDELGLAWRFTPATVDKPSDAPEDSNRRTAEVGEALTINPVVAGGLVYFQHLREIFALRAPTGAVAWRYDAHEGEPKEDGEWEAQAPIWQSPAVHGDVLFAAVPGRQAMTFGYESVPESTGLVALRAASGDVLWRKDRQDVAPDLTDVSFDPAPVVRDGRLYVVGRRRRSFGFEDCYLFCLKAADGTTQFRTHLGSASTGTFASRQATLSIPALQRDGVLVCTNLGTVACVSAYTGSVRWLRLYDRDRAAAARRSERAVRDVKPWYINPVINAGDRVIVMPIDAMRLFVLAADDGRVLRAPGVKELGDAVTLLGVQGDMVCTAGDGGTACYDIARGDVTSLAALPVGAVIEGRAVWATDRVLVPLRSGLSVFPLPSGARIDMAWDANGAGGNLLAFDDQLLVAGDGSVSAYVRKSEIWTRLKRAMANEPSNPVPALELMEVALRAAELPEAQSALEEAVRRADDFAAPLGDAVRKQFFEGILALAEALSKSPGAQSAALDKLHGYAALCAPDEESHVVYRLRFAAWFEALGALDRTMRLYQQILRDRSLRERVVTIGGGRSESAGAFARGRITQLVEDHGPEVYAPFEDEALRLLERARSAGDAAGLAMVAETFPNSSAAAQAMLAEADVLARGGAHEAAARRLASTYHRYSAQIDRPTVLRRIADEFEAAGASGHAYRWLTKAAREFPNARTDAGGRSLTFLEYRDRLQSANVRVEPSRATITLPLAQHYVRSIGAGGALLPPRFDADPMGRWSTAYVFEQDAIDAYDPTLQKSRWAQSLKVRMAPELLLAAEKVAVFATMYEVFGLDTATGQKKWSYGTYPAVLQDENADWENTGIHRRHALHDGRLVSVMDGGKIVCLSVEDGVVLWEKSHPVTPKGPIALSDSWVVYHSTDDERRAILCVLDAADGSWVGALVTEEQRAVEELFACLGGEIVMATSQSISAYDVDSMSRRWRVPLQDHLQGSSMVVDLEAVYFSTNSRQVEKLSLLDGRTLWRSEPIAPYGAGELTLHVIEGSVLTSTEGSAAAVDATSGATLWIGTLPDHPRLLHRALTQAYLVAIDVQPESRQADSSAVFYDHRNASGVIPRDGGVCKLGRITDRDLKAVLVLDDALLVQCGGVIEVWGR